MIIPVGEQHETQVFKQYDKKLNGEVTCKDLLHVMYVPLCDKNVQLRGY